MAALSVLLARHLGREGFGEYALIAALLVVANLFTTFGTDMHLIREVAAGRGLRWLPAALALQLLLSGVLIALVYRVPHALPFYSEAGTRAFRLFAWTLVPLSFFSVFTTALRGKQRMGGYALLNFGSVWLQVAAGLTVWWLDGDLAMLAWLSFAAQAASALGAGLVCALTIPGFWAGWRLPVRGTFLLARASLPAATFAVAGIVYQRAALLALPFLAGTAETGVFSAAARVVEAAKAGHFAAFTALYPAMAQASSERKDWFRRFRLPWGWLLALSVVGAGGLAALAGPLVRALFGAAYAETASVLSVLAWTLPFYALNNFWLLACLANHQERLATGVLAASAAGLLALMGAWGEVGAQAAAWAVLTVEVGQSLLLFSLRGRITQSPVITGGTNEFPQLFGQI